MTAENWALFFHLLGLGSVLVLAFGLWLVHLEHVGYGAGWVDAAIGLFVVMMALGGLGGRAPKRARLLAEAGRDGDELRRLLTTARRSPSTTTPQCSRLRSSC